MFCFSLSVFVSYVVTASDLHPVSSHNIIVKYADEWRHIHSWQYNQNTCKAEIQHIEQWANCNNLKLNRSKSKEIVFTKPRSCRQTDLPPPIVQGFERVQRISVLGVTLTYSLSMTTHIDNIITSCARVLYGLRTLRSHGLVYPDGIWMLLFLNNPDSDTSWLPSGIYLKTFIRLVV